VPVVVSGSEITIVAALAELLPMNFEQQHIALLPQN
jgi:hypothetical protein